MTKNFSTWVLPITVSLLIHGLFVVLLDKIPTINKPISTQAEAISVEILASPKSQRQKKAKSKSNNLESRQAAGQEIKPEIKDSAQVQHDEKIFASETSEPEISEKLSANNPQSQIHPVTKLTKLPSFLTKIEPIYPLPEQHSGTQAYVLAEITLNANGKLLDINIVKSAGNHFDNAVLLAIKQSTFSPGYIGANPVAVKVVVPFRFKLK